MEAPTVCQTAQECKSLRYMKGQKFAKIFTSSLDRQNFGPVWPVVHFIGRFGTLSYSCLVYCSCSSLNKYGSPGTLVPRATTVIEVTLSFKCVKQPNCEATSPMTAVITPIPHIETRNEGQPPPLSAHICMGGVQRCATHMRQTQK